MSTPTDDRPDLLTIIASMHAAPGQADELREELKEAVRNTVQQEGCVNYDLHESVEEPGTFYIYENWKSLEHNEATWPSRTRRASSASWGTCSTRTGSPSPTCGASPRGRHAGQPWHRRPGHRARAA